MRAGDPHPLASEQALGHLAGGRLREVEDQGLSRPGRLPASPEEEQAALRPLEILIGRQTRLGPAGGWAAQRKRFAHHHARGDEMLRDRRPLRRKPGAENEAERPDRTSAAERHAHHLAGGRRRALAEPEAGLGGGRHPVDRFRRDDLLLRRSRLLGEGCNRTCRDGRHRHRARPHPLPHGSLPG